MASSTFIAPISERYLSLDVLRGLTVALMIVVNTPGDWNAIYAPLKHADWNGFTPTDWVFPTFLFVVGNALSFSMKKMVTISSAPFLQKVLKRTIIIFLIGLFLNGFPFFTYEDHQFILKKMLDIRLWGVMQRIAVCYFFGSLIVFCFNKSGVIIISLLLLIGYWFILYRYGEQPNPYSLEGNIIGKIDRLYLQPKNIYKHYPIPFDPLGLLSTLPAIVNVVVGYLVGKFIQQKGNNKYTITRLAVLGSIILLVAYGWDSIFPINKALWTSSYVLCATGYDLLVLSGLMLIIETWKVKKWTYFLEVFGKNPLFIYVISWVVISLMLVVKIDGRPVKAIIYQNLFTNWLSPINASLLFAVVYMLLMWLIGYFMDQKKIYIKV
jgi:predicted acyltransferase